jgi:hypothetical protein
MLAWELLLLRLLRELLGELLCLLRENWLLLRERASSSEARGLVYFLSSMAKVYDRCKCYSMVEMSHGQVRCFVDHHHELLLLEFFLQEAVLPSPFFGGRGALLQLLQFLLLDGLVGVVAQNGSYLYLQLLDDEDESRRVVEGELALDKSLAERTEGDES